MPEEEVSKRVLPDHLTNNLDIIIVSCSSRERLPRERGRLAVSISLNFRHVVEGKILINVRSPPTFLATIAVEKLQTKQKSYLSRYICPDISDFGSNVTNISSLSLMLPSNRRISQYVIFNNQHRHTHPKYKLLYL